MDVTFWGRTAMVAGDYRTKGKPAMLEGRLHLERWHDRQTGEATEAESDRRNVAAAGEAGGGPQSARGTQPASGEDSAASGEYDHASQASRQKVSF